MSHDAIKNTRQTICRKQWIIIITKCRIITQDKTCCPWRICFCLCHWCRLTAAEE